jgi:dGTPase
MSFSRVDSPSPAHRALLDSEDGRLARYAMRTGDTMGRRFAESPHPYRTEFMRDRDRVVHSSAFRRLMLKTQVFIGQPNDHQRTRLTHTLEVSQIARTAARNLGLNEDLTETVALAHDLGHPPFGHCGERALDELMSDHGGFEHNRQGLRAVDLLEERYPDFGGLNLTYESLESIALHSRQRNHPELAEFHPGRRMLAESQIVDVADSIAYDAHDIDDALGVGLLRFEHLRDVEIWRLSEDRARERHSRALDGPQLSRAVIRSLINWQVDSLLVESRGRLGNVSSVDDVRQAKENVIALAPDVERLKRELEHFLFARVYRHEQVVQATQIAERMIRRLFEHFLRNPGTLPEKYRVRLDVDTPERVTCDYVAGMTDRFAQRLHESLFGS